MSSYLRRASGLLVPHQSSSAALPLPAPLHHTLKQSIQTTTNKHNAVHPTRILAQQAAARSSSSPSFIPLTPQSLSTYPATRVTRLSNGLRVATDGHKINATNTATVGVWIDTGSRYESEENNGVAHFLEHMSFKGTAKRSRIQLEQEIENLGAHLNAYTSREQTVYYAKVFKKDVSQALDILSDILRNSKIDADSVDAERHVIIRESHEVNQQLQEVVFDHLHATAYRGTSLGRTILGTRENIESITQQQIRDYVATHYTAPRMVVVGAGSVDHDELVRLAEKYFGSVPTDPTNGKEPRYEPAIFTGSDIRIRDDTTELAHLAIGWPTAGWLDADNYPLMVIQTILGSWDRNVHGGSYSTSYLISTVAENDAAHSFTTFNTQYSDTGLFGVYAIAEPTTLNNLMFAITRAITGLAYDIDEQQLQEAKTTLKMNMLSHLDGSTQVAEDVGRQLLTYGRRLHPSEIIARIDAVDAAAVRRCALRYFHDRDFAMAAIGNLHELPDYNWIRNRTWFSRF